VGKRGHNEGSIYQRADGRWVAAITVANADGSTRRAQRYAKTRKAAHEALRDLQRQIEDGVQALGKTPTLAAYLDQWLEGSAKPSVKVKTYEGYESIVRIRVVPRIGGLQLSQVTPPVIQKLYADLSASGLSQQSVIHTHRCLRRALKQAVNWGLIARNPCDSVDPPRARREELRVWNRGEAAKFLTETRDHSLYPLFALALTTGMRQGELLGLKWSDVELSENRLRVQRTLQRQRGTGLVFETPKTAKSRRTIMLSSVAVVALREHRQRQLEQRLALGPAWADYDLVFPNEIGEPRHPSPVTRSFKSAVTAAGVPDIRFHDLRHTAATLLLTKGQHAKVVSEMLGHATITITLDTYSHYVSVLHEQAAQAMDDLFGDEVVA